MASNNIDMFDQLKPLGLGAFSSLSIEKLNNLNVDEFDKFLKVITELDLDDLSPTQTWTLTRLVHFISTIQNPGIYSRYFEHAQGNIRVMINEPNERADNKALYRSSQKTYNYSIDQKIDFGNRSFSEDLRVAEFFGGKTIFHVYGEYYRINFKNDSMFYDELEYRMKRGTTGVVRGKIKDDKGVQHYLVVIEEHPDQQKYDDNATGTSKTHVSK